MEKQNRWKEDCMVFISRDTRAKLKLQAALRGITLKDYFDVLANQESVKNEKLLESEGYRNL